MPDESGSFQLPQGVPDPGLEDPYGLSVNVDTGGHMTPIVTVPGGDLQPSEQWSSPTQGAGSTTPFDPDHNSLDAAIWNANHPAAGALLPDTPSDPLHLGGLPGGDMLDNNPTDLGPGDYLAPSEDPAVGDNYYSDDAEVGDSLT